MADYYTNMSFAFEMPSDELAKKAIALLADIDQYIEEQTLPEGLEEFKPFLAEGMQSSIVAEADGAKVWVRDDCGYPFLELVVAWLKEVLKRYHPEGAIGFDYSNDCSKAQPNSFGCGAFFITKNSEKWITTWQWLADSEKDWVADGDGAMADE